MKFGITIQENDLRLLEVVVPDEAQRLLTDDVLASYRNCHEVPGCLGTFAVQVVEEVWLAVDRLDGTLHRNLPVVRCSVCGAIFIPYDLRLLIDDALYGFLLDLPDEQRTERHRKFIELMRKEKL